jgi:exonuclease III
VRIATWNMDYWKRSSELRAGAWTYLVERVRPEIALLQECNPTGIARSTVFREGGLLDTRVSPPRKRGWGSAVVSFGPKIAGVEFSVSPFCETPVALLGTYPGSVAIAEVFARVPLVVVSAYGVIDHGYADSTIHRILSDLTPLIDQRKGRGIVVAGDLNVTTQWSAKHRSLCRGRHNECYARTDLLFRRFQTLGFRNVVVRSESAPLEGCGCLLQTECSHVRTQRHKRSSFPWQNDYIFLSEDLCAAGPTVEVLDNEEAWRYSEHFPVVVNLPTA